MSACEMVKRRNSTADILASLNFEMRQPHITASARAAMHKGPRKLVFIDSFHGHACSRCGCRFPETKPGVLRSVSVKQRRQLHAIHRKEEFAAHQCSS
jgi:hypothetical protein